MPNIVLALPLLRFIFSVSTAGYWLLGFYFFFVIFQVTVQRDTCSSSWEDPAFGAPCTAHTPIR
jgi:hypothetical protein